MLKMADPPFRIHDGTLRIAHRVPGRVRLKAGFLRHPRLRLDLLEAHAASLPGVVRVRVNARAGCMVVRCEGSLAPEDLCGRLTSALRKINYDLCAAGPARTQDISRSSVAGHVCVVAASCFAPLWLRIGMALFVGLPVILDGVKNLFSSGVTAKTLDAVSISLAFMLRQYPAVALIAFMRLLGDYLKQLNDNRSNELLTGLLRFGSGSVWVERGGVEVEMDSAAVEPGDVVICGPGDLVMVDGTVCSGTALLNKSQITGESLPEYVEEGDTVVSGAVVESGRLRIQAHKAGAQTNIASLRRFMWQALEDKSRPEFRGEVLADKLVPVTLGVSAGAYALTGELARAASAASIDYVCSVKYPAHFSVKSGMCAAAKCGVLLKGASALDALAGVDTVVFDKTGTLTGSDMRVTDIIPTKGWSRDEVLALAARMERHYDHPVARTILAAANASSLRLGPVADVDFYVSHGICALVDGKRSQVGSRRFISRLAGLASDKADSRADQLRGQGKMVLYVAQNNVVQGLIALRSEVRPDAQATVDGLRALGVRRIIVLTGDHRKTAKHLLAQVRGIDAAHWELGPEDKARVVNNLKRQGARVAVVGDGVNDAPALVCADIGVCMAHGGDLARVSAQAVILNDDLQALCAARAIAMRQRKVLEFCHHEGALCNTALLGCALSGLLSPFGAALLHNLNTLALVGYAVRAGGKQPETHHPALEREAGQ